MTCLSPALAMARRAVSHGDRVSVGQRDDVTFSALYLFRVRVLLRQAAFPQTQPLKVQA